MFVRELWRSLDQAPIGTAEYVRIRMSSVSPVRAYAARRVADGMEAVLLELATENLPGGGVYPSANGFSVVAQPVTPGRSGVTRLILALTNRRYEDVFGSLADDVLRGVAAASGERAAVEAFISRLSRWQSFMRRQGVPLTLEERRGLVGELFCMIEVIEPAIGGSGTIAAWRGYSAAAHDFQRSHASIEVKATAAVTPHIVHISNVGQLQPVGSPLYLCVVHLAEHVSGDYSLPDLIALVTARLEAGAADDLTSGLVEAGYVHSHAELYQEPRYSLLGLRTYRVLPDFPRIHPDTLPSGVEDVSFCIALSACGSFECSVAEILPDIKQE